MKVARTGSMILKGLGYDPREWPPEERQSLFRTLEALRGVRLTRRQILARLKPFWPEDLHNELKETIPILKEEYLSK